MSRRVRKALGLEQGSSARPRNRRSSRIALEALEDRLAPAATPVSFGVIGDFGGAAAFGGTFQPEQNVANLVHSWNPDFVITLGDNAYPDSLSTTMIDTDVGQYYHDFIYPYKGTYGAGATTNRFWPSLGNHDWGNDGQSPNLDQPYLDYFTLPGNGRYYKFSQGPVDFFVVDADGHEPDGNTSTSIQAAWLKSALAQSTQPWKVVYFHEPPYSSGLNGVEPNMNWPFKQWGASVVLAGHSHDYERLSENGLTYFVNGVGGDDVNGFSTPLPGSIVRDSEYGAMKVNASSTQMNFQFINLAGTVIDTYTMNYALPAAPSNLAVTQVSGNQINLTWADNATNETGYIIQRSADGTNWTQIASVSAKATHYLDSGLNSGTYYYQVAAYNAGGNSAFAASPALNIVQPQAASPDAPTGLTATAAGASEIDLAWTDNSGGLDSFVVNRSTDGINFTQTAAPVAGTTSYADTGLAPGTYFYQISAVNTSGPTTPTLIVSATTSPAAPGNLIATAVSGHEVDLSWTENSTNVTGFNILRSPDGVTYSTIATVGVNSTSYADLPLSNSTTYYYQVSAYNSTGSSTFAAANATTPAPVPPAAPSNVTAAAASTTTVNLNWTDNSTNPEEQFFKILKSTDGVTYNWSATVGQDVQTFLATQLLAGTHYYFEVVASNADGDSPASNSAPVTTISLPAAPSNLTATVPSGTRVNLSWTDNSQSGPTVATSFKLYRSTDQVSWSWFATTGQGVTSYAWSSGTPSTTYYFYVTASASVGDSTPSNTVTATTLAVPAAPSNFTGNAFSTTRIDLSWTDNSGTGSTNPLATSFKLFRSTDQVSWSWFGTAGQGASSYTWWGATASSTYYFYVKASITSGDSVASNTITITTPGVPRAPSNLVATAASSTKVTFSWLDNSVSPDVATTFRLYRSTDQVNWSWFGTANQGVTSYTWSSGSAGTTYYFQVRANDANGVSAPSNTSSATTVGSVSPVTAPTAPTNLTATAATSSQINLSWTNTATNQNGFYIYQSPDGTSFTRVASAAAGLTSYAVIGLSASTTYYFQVAAYNPVGTSAATSTASATTSASPSGGSHLVAGTAPPNPGVIVGLGQSIGWSQNLGAPASVGVYVYNPDGTLTADEHARIDDAIAALNNATWNGTTGLNIYEVSDPSLANIVVENAAQTLQGGKADGLLGDTEFYWVPSASYQTDDNGNPYLQFNGLATVNVVEGWNFYAGQDSTRVPAGAYDYETVILHELGHAVGLYHDTRLHVTINDGYSVMYPALNSGLSRRQLSSYDNSWLQHLYAYGPNPGVIGSPSPIDGIYVGGSVPASELTPELMVRQPAPEVVALADAAAKQVGVPAARQPGLGLPATASTIVVSPPASGSRPAVFSLPQGTAGQVQLPNITAALPVASTGTAVLSPVTAMQTSALGLPQDNRIESGGGDENSTLRLEDEASPNMSPETDLDIPTGMATPRAGAEQVTDALLTRPAPWSEASTAYFVVLGKEIPSTNGNAPTSWCLGTFESSGMTSALAAAAFWGMLGAERRAPSMELRPDRRWLKKA